MLKTVFRLVLAGATVFISAHSTTLQASEESQLRRLPEVTPVEARLNASDVWVIRGQDCTNGYHGGGLGCCDNGGLGCCDAGCGPGGCGAGGCCDNGGYDNCCDPSVTYGCCGLPGAYVLAEVMFLKYHRAEGLAPANTFGYEAAPRITVGYTGPGGLGGRLRWWEYDHTAGAVRVNTYNIDAEVYQRVAVGCRSTVEISGGVRYNEFSETGANPPGLLFGNLGTRFSGWGGMVALEGTRQIRRGHLYARARGVMLFDDATLTSTFFGVPVAAGVNDVMPSVTELTLGWRGMRALSNGAVLTGDVAFEAQNWSNYAASGTGLAPRATDVGFAGITLGLGLLY
jgi:hypothetical protein